MKKYEVDIQAEIGTDYIVFANSKEEAKQKATEELRAEFGYCVIHRMDVSEDEETSK